VAGFAVVSVLVRAAHPGAAGTAATNGRITAGALEPSARIVQEAGQNGAFFQSGAIAPSAPSSQAQASTQTS